MSHADTVRTMYAAFGRADIDTILANLAPDVEWDCDRAPNDVPWLQSLRGRHEVPKFFAALAAEIDLRRFEPKLILESGDTVMSLCEVEGYARRTGQRIPEREGVHVWRFDAAGRARSFKHAVDSYGASQVLRAG